MLAMSPRRRLISAGEPAPSTTTRSAVRCDAARSSPAPSAAARLCALPYSRAASVAQRFPCTTICAPRSVSGFRSTGFMCTEGATRAARACSICARPISPPSRDAGIVRHVLRLERRHLQPAIGEGAAEPGNDQRLADIRAGALDHDGGRHCPPRGRAWLPAQNSIPFCAFTPERNGCFTCSISVTRSAASISSSLAFRPVTTTCFIGGRAFSAATTSSVSR